MDLSQRAVSVPSMTTLKYRFGIVAVVAFVLTAAIAVAAPRGGTVNRPALKRGKILFVAACGSCHTLAAAGTRGTQGPNLAEEPTSYSEIVARVRRGGEGMPSFGGKLTKAQIAGIAAFVVASTPRGSGGEDD